MLRCLMKLQERCKTDSIDEASCRDKKTRSFVKLQERCKDFLLREGFSWFGK